MNNEVPLFLFAKKDDAEGTDFYYLGQATSSDPVQTKMPGENGKNLDVVTMDLNLEYPIDAALYDYLTTGPAIEDAKSRGSAAQSIDFSHEESPIRYEYSDDQKDKLF